MISYHLKFLATDYEQNQLLYLHVFFFFQFLPRSHVIQTYARLLLHYCLSMYMSIYVYLSSQPDLSGEQPQRKHVPKFEWRITIMARLYFEEVQSFQFTFSSHVGSYFKESGRFRMNTTPPPPPHVVSSWYL